MNFFTDNIFVLSIKKYEQFSLIISLSKKFGKQSFFIKNSAIHLNQFFDAGFLIKIKYIAKNSGLQIIDYRCYFSFDDYNAKRLFAVQSIASMIDKFVKNIDDINFMILSIPQIISIFYKKDWLKIYLQIEFQIISRYCNFKNKNIKRINSKKQNNSLKNTNNNINTSIKKFNSYLQTIENILYNFDTEAILPKERVFFKKMLVNF